MKWTALIFAGLCFLADGCCRLSADEPVILFPTIETPTPEPVKPRIVDTVTAGTWYVIQSEKPLQVRHYPNGMLAVHAIPGPATFLGMYPDSQKIEVHQFSLAHLYVLQPVEEGKTTLVLTTVHNDQVHVIEQQLTVSLKGPRPPPVDPIEPVKSFRVIFVKESGQTLPIAQSGIPSAKEIRDYLTRKTTPENGLAGWREFDPDFKAEFEQPTMKALWLAVKPKIQVVPCLVVEVNGHVTVMPFPANVAECMMTLEKHGGE